MTALMPTASTSHNMGNYEAFEPYRKMLFVRTTLAGEFIVINENLVKDLIKENLWSDDMRKLIIINKGSVQQIDTIPQKLKDIYKTAFEIKLKSILSQSADRGPFIDQSQSMNLFMNKLDPDILTSAHFYGWERGLKTGMYYLRTTPAVEPIQFGIDISDIIRLTGKSGAMDLIMDSYKLSSSVTTEIPAKSNDEFEAAMCKYIPGKNAEGCLMCSS
jgi:ribonucleotide reductase alpha subunit